MAAAAMTDVFISYSRRDQELVRRLDEALEGAGRSAWVDWQGIPPSAEWLAEVYGAIDKSTSVLFILSPDSVSSAVCGLELAHAAGRNKRLIPVVVRDCRAEEVPEALRRRNWVLLRPEDDFAAGVARLLEALDTDLPWVRNHTRLLVRATEWEAKGRDASLLLRGRDLKEAETWLSAAASHGDPQPAPLQIEFLVASRRAATRRQRIVLAATAAALVLSIALAIWAVVERDAARRQTQLAVANNLLVESRNERHDSQVRVLLAVESLRRLRAQGRASTEVIETVDAVASLRARPLGSARIEGDPGAIALSTRGDRMAAWDQRRVVIRNTLGMGGARELQAPGNVRAVAFHPHAAVVAVATDGNVRSYGLALSAPPPADFPCEGEPLLVRFDPTGKRLAVVTARRVCLWATDAPRLLAQAEIPTGTGEQAGGPAMVFSGDAKLFAALLPKGNTAWQALLVDAGSGRERRRWEFESRIQPRVAFREATLVVASSEAIWGWSDAQGREVSRWTFDDQRWQPLALSPDGRFAIVQISSGASFVMDDFSYTRIGLYDAAGGIELGQMEHAPHDFTPDGRYLIDGQALLQLPSLRTARVLPSAGAHALVVSADSTVAVTVSGARVATAWRLGEAPEVAAVPLDPDAPMPRAFHPHQPAAAIASGREVQLIPLGDPSKSTQVRAAHRVDGLRFSDDGRYLIGVGEGRLTLWDWPGLAPRVAVAVRAVNVPSKAECGYDPSCLREVEQPWIRQLAPLRTGSRFVAWDHGGLSVWSVPGGKLVYQDPRAEPHALLEAGGDLVIGRADGGVTILDPDTWRPRVEKKVHSAGIQKLVAVGATNLLAAVTDDPKLDFWGQPDPAASRWSLSLFDARTGQPRGSHQGAGLLGPWSADGTLVAVRPDESRVDILRPADGERVRAVIKLRRTVRQRARPLAFTAGGRYLVAESDTPVTGGRAEPALHVIDTATGAATLRMPERDLEKDTIRLERALPYPEHFLADGAHDLVAAVVYRNADAYWSLAAGRADKQLTVWQVTDRGKLTPVLRTPAAGDIEPAAFLANGRYLATAPVFHAEVAEVAGYALGLWAVGQEDRLHLACASAGGNLSTADWSRFIGRFTGEGVGRTCEGGGRDR